MGHYLVVGGSSGIGEALVQLLEAQEHQVSIICRRDFSSKKAAIYQANVLTDPLPELSDALDGLVYCPGSINLKSFPRLTTEDFLNDFKINCLGAVQVIQNYLPILRKAPSPSIVLFSTVAVAHGMAFHSSVASSKGAVEGLTRALAAELAPDIRVNCIAPSLTETPLAQALLRRRGNIEKQHPLHRIGSPHDIAAATQYLLSADASWITGQVLAVDGGLSTLSVF